MVGLKTKRVITIFRTGKGTFCTPPVYLVAEAGLEPARPCGHRVLSPARLPFRHSAKRWTIGSRPGSFLQEDVVRHPWASLYREVARPRRLDLGSVRLTPVWVRLRLAVDFSTPTVNQQTLLKATLHQQHPTFGWSGPRDSNPQPSAWKTEALPLRQSRSKASFAR